MLKLMIADDERVIRETISRLVDWKALGIELVGICRDGAEAYHKFLDTAPDIVMTDIRMPGISGLELVQKIAEMDPGTQCIILSGYGEFEYARKAMKYGVRHYLLKPCDEKQIVDTINQVAEDVRKARQHLTEKDEQIALRERICQDAMYHLLREGILMETESLQTDEKEWLKNRGVLWTVF